MPYFILLLLLFFTPNNTMHAWNFHFSWAGIFPEIVSLAQLKPYATCIHNHHRKYVRCRCFCPFSFPSALSVYFPYSYLLCNDYYLDSILNAHFMYYIIVHALDTFGHQIRYDWLLLFEIFRVSTAENYRDAFVYWYFYLTTGVHNKIK